MASAANRTITGVVISGEDNEPLIGASVYVHTDELKKNGSSEVSLGTVTDIDGKFSLSIPEKTTRIHCSYIGFEEQILLLQAGKNDYRIILQPSAHTLGDVIVTGYQEVERRKLTAAITKIDVTDAMVGSAKSIDQALAGQIAGVAVTTTSGAPGAPARIRIRGTASLNGTQDPLWVLDGIPLEGTDIPKLDDDTSNDIVNIKQSSIAGISPNDIESITILKDAAATAIYGARAANGVIVIETKQGLVGKTRFNFSLNYGITERPVNNIHMMNTAQKIQFEREFATDEASWLYEPGQVMNILRMRDMGKYTTEEAEAKIAELGKIDTDWFKEIFRTAISQQYNFSMSGGSEKNTTLHFRKLPDGRRYCSQ